MSFLDFFRKKKTTKVSEQKPVVTRQNVSAKEIEEILNREISHFFPETGHWMSNCFERSREVSKSNLPCHLRDNCWMSKLLHEKLADKNIFIPVSQINAFMDNSEEFNQLRHNYELEIVRWQINYMRNGGDGWLMPKGHDELSLMFDYDIDKIFREGVVQTLSAIGINRDAIEEGIERNSDLWREHYMHASFVREFEPAFYILNRMDIKPADESHKQNWLKLRRYEYYADHKRSVDKYGQVEPDMLITDSELEKLRATVSHQNEERKKVLADCNRATKFSDEERT